VVIVTRIDTISDRSITENSTGSLQAPRYFWVSTRLPSSPVLYEAHSPK